MKIFIIAFIGISLAWANPTNQHLDHQDQHQVDDQVPHVEHFTQQQGGHIDQHTGQFQDILADIEQNADRIQEEDYIKPHVKPNGDIHEYPKDIDYGIHYGGANPYHDDNKAPVEYVDEHLPVEYIYDIKEEVEERPSFWDWVSDTASDVKDQASDVFDDATSYISDTADTVKDTASDAYDDATNFISDAAETTRVKFRELSKAVASVFETTYRATIEELPAIREQIRQTARDVVGYVKYHLSDFGKLIKAGAETCFSIIAKGTDSVAELDLINKLKAKLEDGNEQVSSFFILVGEKMKHWVELRGQDQEIYETTEQENALVEEMVHELSHMLQQDQEVRDKLTQLVQEDVLTPEEADLFFTNQLQQEDTHGFIQQEGYIQQQV